MTKILVVDDAAFMRSMLKRILEDEGYEVQEAPDGDVAIKKYTEMKYDLVTMDIVMPKVDGVTAVKEIIRIDPEARIIMITALAHKTLVLRALRAGARDFIVKPFDSAAVIEAVKNTLKS
jgi:two-component system, chemotaxis family, chemotaxis protein CheY